MRALIVAAVLAFLAVAQAQSPPIFYSYTGSSGRTVYVNRFSMVPPEKRSSARAIDLSEVSLNEELAVELSDAVEDELRQLKDSDPCIEARQEDAAGAWRHVWHRHGPWILASLAAMVLVLMTPWMVARTPPGVWSRLLMVALPASPTRQPKPSSRGRAAPPSASVTRHQVACAQPSRASSGREPSQPG